MNVHFESRRPMVLASLLLLAGSGLACRARFQGDFSGRSVVLISLDTVRADHLSHHGYQRDTTPFMAELARRCFVFDNTVAQSASTVPSHRALLTGRYAWHVRPEDPYLAEVFASAGYDTAAFTGSGGVSAELGFSRGFSHWFEAHHPHRTFQESLPALEAWLRARTSKKPLFLFLHTYDPHHPYDPPAPFDAMFSTGYAGPINGPATHQLLSKLARVPPNADFRGYLPVTSADRERIVALYDGQLRYTDDRLRELFRVLAGGGLDNGLLVITSDHGEEFWEHGGVLHSHTLHRELVHVPLLICPPSQRGGGHRIDQVVRHVDLGPTLLDLLAIDRPPSFQGRSLRPILERDEFLDLPGVSELNWFKSVRDRRFKLMLDQRDRRMILYDMKADPREQRDLFGVDPHRALALYKRMAKELGEGMNASVATLDEEAVSSRRLREQLRALGYIQ